VEKFIFYFYFHLFIYFYIYLWCAEKFIFYFYFHLFIYFYIYLWCVAPCVEKFCNTGISTIQLNFRNHRFLSEVFPNWLIQKKDSWLIRLQKTRKMWNIRHYSFFDQVFKHCRSISEKSPCFTFCKPVAKNAISKPACTLIKFMKLCPLTPSVTVQDMKANFPRNVQDSSLFMQTIIQWLLIPDRKTSLSSKKTRTYSCFLDSNTKFWGYSFKTQRLYVLCQTFWWVLNSQLHSCWTFSNWKVSSWEICAFIKMFENLW